MSFTTQISNYLSTTVTFKKDTTVDCLLNFGLRLEYNPFTSSSKRPLSTRDVSSLPQGGSLRSDRRPRDRRSDSVVSPSEEGVTVDF